MGEIGEKVKTFKEEIRSIERGKTFNLENLESGLSDVLIEDFVFDEETLLSAKAYPIRESNPTFAIEFNLTTDPDEEKKHPSQPITGIRAENMLIVAEKPFDPRDRYRVAIGKEEVRGDERVVTFDQWHPLPRLHRKPDILRMLKSGQLKKPQPLTALDTDLKAIKFLTL